jgi:competence protein ComEA
MRIPATVCAAILLSVFIAAAQDKLPEGPGKAAVLKICQGCHPADVLASRHKTRDDWEHTVIDMINAGANGTDEEFEQVVEYLAKNFPPKVNVNKAAPAVLVNGLGITAQEADAIVAHREKNGAFKNPEDLKAVAGLDYAKIEAKKDRLQF